MDKIQETLTRGVANIIPGKEELEKILRSGKKLNVYLGIDPTATKIHLGHAIPLRKLQAFAELGHNVIFLIGDFTALIGDTSDKDSERPSLTSEQIEQNFKDYKKQAEKILDFSKVQIKHNSQWLKNLSFTETIRLTHHFSLGDFISRELIKKRLTEGKKVGLHEVLYPVMQGYDSYIMDTDLQLGGTDQTFNMQAGRTLQKNLRNKESFVLSNIFLTGTDGLKMSKTGGNAIWLEDEPTDMYGKVMSIKDNLIIEYYILATKTELSEVEKIKSRLSGGENPMTVKKLLAFEITSELHGENNAQQAQEYFEKTVQKQEIPEDLPVLNINAGDKLSVVDVLVNAKMVDSRSEAKRLIEQNGLEIDENIVKDIYFKPQKGEHNLRIGKRRFIKLFVN
ncbi:MAG: tyrosine--tRNA ligase [Candidatus Levybacteria bacterium RIFCSPHIGHO2_01_FULL_36_15]|nr:MAG: tyrosine--tRNA ligase [Candidatus Levybacteria bacterium RIFCSPHIGHO2_01_FULL_36_15]OGH38162.1 MAG: tyrosine--tRNA ligase [Candidatus Levybacteria bacterium RIFCSPLOWO2_01_FULL_36_10]